MIPCSCSNFTKNREINGYEKTIRFLMSWLGIWRRAICMATSVLIKAHNIGGFLYEALGSPDYPLLIMNALDSA